MASAAIAAYRGVSGLPKPDGMDQDARSSHSCPPVIGFVAGFILMVAVYWICSPMDARPRSTRLFGAANSLSAAARFIGQWRNDAQKTVVSSLRYW